MNFASQELQTDIFKNPNYSRQSRRTTIKLWPQFKRDVIPISPTSRGLQPTGSPCDAGALRYGLPQ